jgi:hypothetical protein
LGRAIYAQDETDALAQHYARVRFGRKQLDEADAVEVKQAWRAVRGRLVRRVLRLPLRAPAEPDAEIATVSQSEPPPTDDSPSA